jgi:hypothetical protein
MNAKLSYKPSILDRIVLFFGWIECQLRAYLIPIINGKDKVRRFTNTMQVKTNGLLNLVSNQWRLANTIDLAIKAYGTHPEIEITAFNILTPALLYLHLRLCLERAHYTNEDEKVFRKDKKVTERIAREINRLMPSWERFIQWRKYKNTKNQQAAIDKSANEISRDLMVIPDLIVRFIYYITFMSFAASFIYFFISNRIPIAYYFARAILSSGLSFDQGLGVIIAIFTVLLLFVFVFTLSLITAISWSQEPEDERLIDVEAKLDYITNILDNEVLPRIDADIMISENEIERVK